MFVCDDFGYGACPVDSVATRASFHKGMQRGSVVDEVKYVSVLYVWCQSFVCFSDCGGLTLGNRVSPLVNTAEVREA